jgi:hypothetical protein
MTAVLPVDIPPRRDVVKGLRQFLDDGQQRAWQEGEVALGDGERPEPALEQRFRYAGRLEKLLTLPQAEAAIGILRTYAATAFPIPRTTERFYWSVSCLPSTDRTLARVNASWMELFALQPDACPEQGPREDGLRARIILHLSDFTTDGSADPDQLDQGLVERCVGRAEDVSHFFWKADTFGLKVRGSDAIRAFLSHPHALRAIRRFNLTHMNRGRNAYQASHCYSLADRMLD